jgi:hypothetical protein
VAPAPTELRSGLATCRCAGHSRNRPETLMTRPQLLAAALLTAVAFALPGRALANADCGRRLFPVTLTLDDPGVGDEAALPTVSYQHFGNNTATPGDDTTVSVNLNKRLTDDFMLGVGGGYDFNTSPPQLGKNQTGWQDLQLLAKWQDCVSAEHEFMFSLGVIRELGRTGAISAGADEYGYTAPAIYAGKGFGDLSSPALRPLAITGELYRTWSDHGLAFETVTNPMTGLTMTRSNGASANFWFGAVSLQYSLVYIQRHMKQIDLPPWMGGLIPVVEFDWISPGGNPTNVQTAWRAASGVIYEGKGYEVAVEAQVPLGRSAGTGLGVIAQVYIFLDDLYPNSIGKPVLEWFH